LNYLNVCLNIGFDIRYRYRATSYRFTTNSLRNCQRVLPAFWGNRGNKVNRLRSNAENVAFFVALYTKYVSYLLPRICRCKAVVSRVPPFLREEAIL